MRLAAVTAFVLALSVSGAAMAQGWSEYTNREDRFSINFPGEPKIQQTTYMPFEGPAVPARVYSAESGDSRYSMTVVDFTKNYAFSQWPFAFSGSGVVQGSIAHAAANFRKRGEVTYDAYERLNLIPGHLLRITEPNGRRLFVSIYLYDRRLYIMEANVPGDAAPPSLFGTSLAVLDSAGEAIRYNEEGLRARGGPPIDDRPPRPEGARR
jgi:hypothetical protein